MNVALVNCPWWVRYCPPYILAYFAALLRSHNHRVSCHDLNNTLYHRAPASSRIYWDNRDYYSWWENGSFTERIFRETEYDRNGITPLLDTQPDVVLLTTHTPSVNATLETARRIKERAPSTIIVLFGHKAGHAQMADDFIRHPSVDYVCPGEADLPVLDLLSRLDTRSARSPLPSVPGMLSKTPDGSIHDGGPRGFLDDLDAMPDPDYSDFADDIVNGRYGEPHRLDILDSRGCVNGCHFCYERLFWPRFRTMSGPRIAGQIETLMRLHPSINRFYFNGLLLNGRRQVIDEFCRAMIHRGIRASWSGQAMVSEFMTRDLLTSMKQAGCTWLGYGIESGSERVLRHMNKPFSRETAVRVLRDTHEAGISVQINLMFGFPGETEDDFQQTLDFLTRVRPYVDNVLASQSFFTLEKTTRVRTHPAEFGVIDASHHLYWTADNGTNTYPSRFDRYERFCAHALTLGIPETSGVLRVKPDKWFLLGDYYSYRGDHERSAACFERSLLEETPTPETHRRLADERAFSTAKTGTAPAPAGGPRTAMDPQ